MSPLIVRSYGKQNANALSSAAVVCFDNIKSTTDNEHNEAVPRHFNSTNNNFWCRYHLIGYCLSRTGLSSSAY